jgi:hypothetical protein
VPLASDDSGNERFSWAKNDDCLAYSAIPTSNYLLNRAVSRKSSVERGRRADQLEGSRGINPTEKLPFDTCLLDVRRR